MGLRWATRASSWLASPLRLPSDSRHTSNDFIVGRGSSQDGLTPSELGLKDDFCLPGSSTCLLSGSSKIQNTQRICYVYHPEHNVTAPLNAIAILKSSRSSISLISVPPQVQGRHRYVKFKYPIVIGPRKNETDHNATSFTQVHSSSHNTRHVRSGSHYDHIPRQNKARAATRSSTYTTERNMYSRAYHKASERKESQTLQILAQYM